MLTERVRKLKEEQERVKPSFTSERARLVTEAYEANEGQPEIIKKARMLEHILANMTIFIQEGELIVGNHTNKSRCAPVYPEFSSTWILDSLDEFESRTTDPLEITPEDKEELRRILPRWQGKCFDEISANALTEEVLLLEKSGYLTVGNRDCSTGHILSDYRKLVKTGYKGLLAEIDSAEEKAGSAATCEQKDFWEASRIALNGAISFARRYSRLACKMAGETEDPAWKAELLQISENCSQVPENPPETFHQAVQLVWFTHIIITIESNGHGNSFHRFDQYTGPFYDADLAAGRITQQDAVEILGCFFIKCTDIIKLRDTFYSESFAGYPIWQNIICGGQNEDGSDATNEVSFLMLQANDDVRTSSPTMSIRYHQKLSKELFDKGIDMIQRGLSTPAFFNDDLVIPMLLNKGYPKEEAWDWGIMGCVQPVAAGKSDGRPTVGYVNSLKCLELVLNRGTDPVSGIKMGLDTGEVTTKEELESAVYKQMEYMIGLMCESHNIVGDLHAKYAQMPFTSCMIDGTIQSGKSIYAGGAKYSESGSFMCGQANTADAIAAVDTLVFREKAITMEELMEALHNDFAGNEKLRQMLLNKAPKYGNDDDYVDGIAAGLLRNYKNVLSRYRDSRGGRYCLVVESQSMNVSQGKCVGATPDGRHRFAPLNDNCSPVMGRDISGPTATVLSVAKLDQINAEDGCLFNLRFDPRSVSGRKGAGVIGGVIKTYFEHMGEHIQINVVDNETLLKAQENPEQYRGLLVRVAGYLAYFTELDKAVQDNIISRTAHTV